MESKGNTLLSPDKKIFLIKMKEDITLSADSMMTVTDTKPGFS